MDDEYGTLFQLESAGGKLQVVQEATYRLRGSWVLRDLARATGSNDFATSSGATVPFRRPSDSSSLRAEDDLGDAWSEAWRRQQRPCARAEGTIARGNDLARYLDGSLAAIGIGG